MSYINRIDATWYTGNSDDFYIKKLLISHDDFNQDLTFYLNSYPTILQLKGVISFIKLSLDIYFDEFNDFPSRRLDFLVSSGILNQLPNNPYTKPGTGFNDQRNITDWHYEINANYIEIYAYTHPSLRFIWSY